MVLPLIVQDQQIQGVYVSPLYLEKGSLSISTDWVTNNIIAVMLIMLLPGIGLHIAKRNNGDIVPADRLHSLYHL